MVRVRLILMLLLLVSLSAVSPAQEQLALTTPVAGVSMQTWRVSSVAFYWDAARIAVWVTNNRTERVFHEYTGVTATNLMIALNKANLSTKSLQARVLEQLALDGVIGPGAVTGTPP